MKPMPRLVYLDTFDVFDPADYPPAELALNASDVRIQSGADDPDWLVPWVKAAEFRRFIGAWARNDPNGTWNPDGIAEGDGALIYACELGRDVFAVAGLDERGVPLYALRGWRWITFRPTTEVKSI